MIKNVHGAKRLGTNDLNTVFVYLDKMADQLAIN